MANNTDYNKKVKDHFMNPRNMGEIEDADSEGTVGNAKCGDVMKVMINVKDNKIDDIKFQTFGCAAAIATSSVMTELAMGKTLKEAKKISNKEVAEKLGGLPSIKMHCSNLAADALSDAIINYEKK
jgi:nitrogen fixation protein NifU and related proteins